MKEKPRKEKHSFFLKRSKKDKKWKKV